MTNVTTTPSVWIGCLSAYNCGHLHGEWVDATLGVEHLQEAADRVIKTSPGDSPEEIFLADNEGFGDAIGEYTALDRVAELAEAIDTHGDAFLAYLGMGREGEGADVDELVTNFEDCYEGEHDSEKDFAYDIVENTGLLHGVDESVKNYFDYDAYARDLFLDGYTLVDGHVFRDY